MGRNSDSARIPWGQRRHSAVITIQKGDRSLQLLIFNEGFEDASAPSSGISPDSQEKQE